MSPSHEPWVFVVMGHRGADFPTLPRSPILGVFSCISQAESFAQKTIREQDEANSLALQHVVVHRMRLDPKDALARP